MINSWDWNMSSVLWWIPGDNRQTSAVTRRLFCLVNKWIHYSCGAASLLQENGACKNKDRDELGGHFSRMCPFFSLNSFFLQRGTRLMVTGYIIHKIWKETGPTETYRKSSWHYGISHFTFCIHEFRVIYMLTCSLLVSYFVSGSLNNAFFSWFLLRVNCNKIPVKWRLPFQRGNDDIFPTNSEYEVFSDLEGRLMSNCDAQSRNCPKNHSL